MTDDFIKARDEAVKKHNDTLRYFENCSFHQVYLNGANWAYEWCRKNHKDKLDNLQSQAYQILQKEAEALAEAHKEITNTTRLNDPDNHLADHLKWLSNNALARWNKFRGDL